MSNAEATPALSWDDLANLYDKSHGGRRARTLPMESIFAWAEKRTDEFYLSDEGTIHMREHAPPTTKQNKWRATDE